MASIEQRCLVANSSFCHKTTFIVTLNRSNTSLQRHNNSFSYRNHFPRLWKYGVLWSFNDTTNSIFCAKQVCYENDERINPIAFVIQYFCYLYNSIDINENINNLKHHWLLKEKNTHDGAFKLRRPMYLKIFYFVQKAFRLEVYYINEVVFYDTHWILKVSFHIF